MSIGLTYFDCFATIGPRHGMVAGEKHTLADLQAGMDRCGIDAALVSTTLSDSYDVMWGNRWLSERIRDNPRLLALWTALPHHTGEVPPPEQFVRQAKAAGVRAVRLCPLSHNYSLDPATIGPLMRALAKAGMPVFIHRGQLFTREAAATEGYQRLASFLAAYPKNRIVLLGSFWTDTRRLFPLLDSHNNLMMEFSSYQANLAVESLVGRYGDERFLFGCNAPRQSPGAARAFIDWADLPATSRKRLAGGNLRKLLGVRSLPKVTKTPADDIVEACWRGRPIDMVEVLDAHAHVNFPGCNGVGGHTQFQGDVAGMKRLFRRVGIQRSAMSAWLGIAAPAPRLGNDITHHAMLDEPDFAIGYACMDPVQMSPSQIAEEIHLRYVQQGFLGLKPYIRTSAAFDDPRYAPWYRFGNQHRLFGLFHGSPQTAAKLARKYKDMAVILAHSGGSIQTADTNGRLAKTSPNIYCEITLTPVTEGAIELLVAHAGAGRVLFGTDSPMRDPRPQLGWVVHADISRAAKVKILGANFAGILRRCKRPRRRRTAGHSKP